MIDITKQYSTIDGHEIRLISDQGQEPYRIVGYIDGSHTPDIWTVDGAYFEHSSPSVLDLVEVPPAPEKAVRYHVFLLGIYIDSFSDLASAKQLVKASYTGYIMFQNDQGNLEEVE